MKTKDEIIAQAIVKLGFSNAHFEEIADSNKEAVMKEAMELWGTQSKRVLLADLIKIIRLLKQLADKIQNNY